MKWDNPQFGELCEALLSLNSNDEVRRFLRDLLTEDEIIEFTKRWQTARLLENGTPYTDITKITGLSSTTIARVALWLQKGMGGYKLTLERLHQHTSHGVAASGLL